MPGQRAPEEERREAILGAAFRVAARERLTGFTMRQVADEAGISKGLVFFYFASRDVLLLALLDWLLTTTIVAPAVAPPTRASPAAHMLAVLRRDIQRLPAQRERVELFFDFWVIGTRHPEIQQRIRNALAAYRRAYRPLAQAVIDADPARFRGVSAEAMAAIATGFVEGCALQAVMDPDRFDVDAFAASVAALVMRPGGQ